MFASAYKLNIMKTARLFNVLVADSSLSFPGLPEQELRKRKLNIKSLTNKKEFIKLIKERAFDLIFICQDKKDFSDEKVVETIRLSEKNLDTVVLVHPDGHPDSDVVKKLFKAGVNDIVYDCKNEKLLLLKIGLFQQFSSDVSRLEKESHQLRKENVDLKARNASLNLSSKHDKALIRKLSSELSNELTENVSTLLEMNERSQLLAERIKELNFLIAITKCHEDENLTIEASFMQIVNNIASAFRYPENICAEIKYKDQLYQSDNFWNRKKKQVICEKIQYQKEAVSRICIFSCKKAEGIRKNAFTQEKKQLLSTIANTLGQIIRRKETDNSLRIFQRAANQSPLMISVSNLKTKIFEFTNPVFSAKFGFAKGDLINLSRFLNSPDKNLNKVRKEMTNAVTQGKVWKGTYKDRKNNGEYFWQKVSLFPLFSNEKLTHVLSISEDISDEVKLAEELKISKENYKHIAQYAPSGIVIVNKEGQFLFANKRAAEISGYSSNELGRRSFKDLVYPSDLPKIQERLMSRLNGQKPENNFELRIITSSDEIKIVEASGSKTKWMDEVSDIIVFNDITEKKRFSDLLNIQYNIDYLNTIYIGLDKSFEQIFENLFRYDWIDAGGIYLMNKSNDYLDMVFYKGLSARFVKETRGIPKESGRFKLIQQKKPLYVSSLDSLPFPENLRQEGIKAIFIYPMVHDDLVIGVLNLASKSADQLSENERMIFESIGSRIAQMIALINARDELRVKNEELQQILKEIQEKQQLLIQKSKLESLGEMAAGVAHEINQPLGVIFLSLENILYKIAGKNVSQEYLDKKLNSISDNVKKVKEIIDHIRTFSRDQKSIIIERVDVNQVVKRSCALIDEQYKYHQISINLKLDEEVGYILGNSHKLEQVMFNLLSNAKFALEEKESLSFDKSFDKKIHISTFVEEMKVFIEVKDNGIGIESENLDHIFNPFFTTKPEGVGTGLGLSIVYGIITGMKGSISIQSKRQEFTLVNIEFPKCKLNA
jgi:PAS domain S-box-containing protein